jgi:hypothetical protein
MVMPGFWIGGSVIQSRVYLSGVKVAEWLPNLNKSLLYCLCGVFRCIMS